MSLINQMLRDLEQRRHDTPKPTPMLEPKSAPKDKSRYKSGGLWLTTLALTLAAVYVRQQNQSIQPAPVSLAATATVTEKPLPHTAPLQVDAQPQPPEPAPLPKETSDGPAANAEPITISTAKPETPKPKPAPRKAPPPKAAAVKVDKPARTLTPAQQADALYQSALASSSMLMTKENLYEALQFNPNHLPARTLLLQTLLKSRTTAPLEIGHFVDDSLRLFPGNLLFVKTRAHLYAQQKNYPAALSTLAQIDADTVDDPVYLSLLAASHQQLQHFPQAARVYQRLCQIQPEKAEHWLGLGVSRDKLNQAQAAAQAYRQALDKNTLNAEVVSYIKQRLGALN